MMSQWKGIFSHVVKCSQVQPCEFLHVIQIWWRWPDFKIFLLIFRHSMTLCSKDPLTSFWGSQPILTASKTRVTRIAKLLWLRSGPVLYLVRLASPLRGLIAPRRSTPVCQICAPTRPRHGHMSAESETNKSELAKICYLVSEVYSEFLNIPAVPPGLIGGRMDLKLVSVEGRKKEGNRGKLRLY